MYVPVDKLNHPEATRDMRKRKPKRPPGVLCACLFFCTVFRMIPHAKAPSQHLPAAFSLVKQGKANALRELSAVGKI